MTRKECYAFIKANPEIKDFIKVRALVNYTILPTYVLTHYISLFKTPAHPASLNFREKMVVLRARIRNFFNNLF